VIISGQQAASRLVEQLETDIAAGSR